MDIIGEQISIKKSPEETSIVILSLKKASKNTMLFVWLFLWSVSGVLMFTQYFMTTDLDVKKVIIVWLGFWIYFEYKIIRAYLWRKTGKEIIKIRNGKILYKLDLSGKGKIKEYDVEGISDFKLVDVKENSFVESISNSYWTIAGERISFKYYGREIKFGYQLNESDSLALLKVIKNNIKK